MRIAHIVPNKVKIRPTIFTEYAVCMYSAHTHCVYGCLWVTFWNAKYTHEMQFSFIYVNMKIDFRFHAIHKTDYIIHLFFVDIFLVFIFAVFC